MGSRFPPLPGWNKLTAALYFFKVIQNKRVMDKAHDLFVTAEKQSRVVQAVQARNRKEAARGLAAV
jgi:hypothetical protein